MTCVSKWNPGEETTTTLSSSSSSSSSLGAAQEEKKGGEEKDESSSSSSSATIFLTGGQDGWLRVWDVRMRSGESCCVHRVEAHTSPDRGTGAVSCIDSSSSSSIVATGGADRRVVLMEPRMSFAVLHTLEEHSDFIYSLKIVSGGGGGGRGVVLSGSGNGMMMCHDVDQGRLLYGLGVAKGAVRCIQTCQSSSDGASYLATAGDDGKCLLFRY